MECTVNNRVICKMQVSVMFVMHWSRLKRNADIGDRGETKEG